MADSRTLSSILKDAQDLSKERENEVNWLKIHKLFEQLKPVATSSEQLLKLFPHFQDLLIRSIQSERSRLNGISLEFLKTSAILCGTSYDFDVFLPILLKLTRKANKLLVTRATDTLLSVGKFVSKKIIYKSILENKTSTNKNTRYAVYKLLELRLSDLSDYSSQLIELALKDPALEVRNIFKNSTFTRPAQSKHIVANERKPIRTILSPPAPRKQLKVIDKQEEKIKSLEEEINKIATYAAAKSTTLSFYEKLNRLKQDKPWNKPQADELTPRRLDRYLDQYRVKQEIQKKKHILNKESINESEIKNELNNEDNKSNYKEENTKDSEKLIIDVKDNTDICTNHNINADQLVDTIKSIDEVRSIDTIKSIDEVRLVDDSVINTEGSISNFMNEYEENANQASHIVGSEMNISIIHEGINETEANAQLGSENLMTEQLEITPVGTDQIFDEDNSLIMQNDLSLKQDDSIGELSKSLINITIEPSVIEMSRMKESQAENLENANLADVSGEDKQGIKQPGILNEIETSIIGMDNLQVTNNLIESTVILEQRTDQSKIEEMNIIKCTTPHNILSAEMFESEESFQAEHPKPIFGNKS